jgi:hypothetical protein
MNATGKLAFSARMNPAPCLARLDRERRKGGRMRYFVLEPGTGDPEVHPHIVAEFGFGAAEDQEEALRLVVLDGPWQPWQVKTAAELHATPELRAALEAWRAADDSDLNRVAAILEANRDRALEDRIDHLLETGDEERAKRLVKPRLHGLRPVPGG